MVSLVISLMTAAASAGFAPAVRHACPADKHACCEGPRLMACCPGDDETPAPSGTPAASRIDVTPVALPLAVAPVPASAASTAALALRDVPNRPPGQDLTILLATFRI